ncbi:MAG: sirohydrochlorin chelatase [Gordonia sp. (in: high G+C Gram-positive bacteria)]
MTTLLVAHGTRNPHGVTMIGDLSALLARRLGEPVPVSFVDVLGPSPSDVLAGLPPERPVRVVPAFLARGHHVRVDIPAHVERAGHPNVTIAPALGPSPVLAQVLAERLAEAGLRPDDQIVLAAAGSSDPRAIADVGTVATQLSLVVGAPVHPAFVAPPADGSGFPAVDTVVARLQRCRSRRRGPARIVVATYLLAAGLFSRRLEFCGADLVAEPLGLHPLVVDLAVERVTAPAAQHVTAR